MKFRLKIKRSLDESNAMAAGSISGAGGPFGSSGDIDSFNKEQEREQRLKGSKLEEMFSTSGIGGRNMQLADEEKTWRGHQERSKAQGLQNFKENKKKRTFKIKIARNPEK
jgi:hypothetical protein